MNYKRQFKRSVDRAEVQALYEEAGPNLNSDLDTLQDAARISADPPAVRYLKRSIIFNGQIGVPVLTLHTKGDGLVVVENESAYKSVVNSAGNGRFLRQDFVDRAGQGAFTPVDTIAAVEKLVDRIDTGKWHEPDASELNTAAAALGPNFNVYLSGSTVVATPPALIDFVPAPYLRPFDEGLHDCKIDFQCW